MRAHQKYRFGGFIVLQKGADRTVPELPSQSSLGWCVSQSGAVVDVVVADDGALEFLRKVVLFIEDFAAAKHADTFGAVFTGDLLKALGGVLDGFIPGDQLQFVGFADIRLGQTLLMINKLMHRKTFDAQIFTV